MQGSGGLGYFQMTIPAGSNSAVMLFPVPGGDDIEILEISPQGDDKYNYVGRSN